MSEKIKIPICKRRLLDLGQERKTSEFQRLMEEAHTWILTSLCPIVSSSNLQKSLYNNQLLDSQVEYTKFNCAWILEKLDREVFYKKGIIEQTYRSQHTMNNVRESFPPFFKKSWRWKKELNYNFIHVFHSQVNLSFLKVFFLCFIKTKLCIADLISDSMVLALYNDSRLFQSMRLQMKIRCKLALTLFPMDIQHCDICLESC